MYTTDAQTGASVVQQWQIHLLKEKAAELECHRDSLAAHWGTLQQIVFKAARAYIFS